jgi:hypothetical protein
MVYFTTTSPFSFDVDCNESTIIKVILIVSTNCINIVPINLEPYVDYCNRSIIPVINTGKIVLLRFSISYNYMHDLNSFSQQLLDDIISQLNIPLYKICIVIED